MENVDLITANTQEMQVAHRNGTHLKFGAAPPIVGTMIALSLLAATFEYESRLFRRFSLSTPDTNGAVSIRENTTTQQIVTTEDVWSALTRVHDTILRDSVELDKLVGDILYEDLWDLYA